jgi:hypothetical protein
MSPTDQGVGLRAMQVGLVFAAAALHMCKLYVQQGQLYQPNPPRMHLGLQQRHVVLLTVTVRGKRWSAHGHTPNTVCALPPTLFVPNLF